MANRVTLHPSAHSFPVEYGETLLEGALRTGIALDYNCNNGRCGKCIARLISGELSHNLPSDFIFTQIQKSQNHILLCRCKPAGDLIIEVNEQDSSNDIPEQTILTKVYKINRINDNFIELQLRTPRNQSLQFLAGQHVSLNIEGIELRNKSIASCPCNGMYLQFHIRKKDDDLFSQYIFESLKIKDTITVTGPYGEFNFNDESERAAVFIAYETGFASIKSLIEHAIAREEEKNISLYWLVSNGGVHYMENYCRAWGDIEDEFYYTPLTIDKPEGDTEKVLQQIVSSVTKITNCDIYISAPDSIVTTALILFDNNKIDRSQIYIDKMKRYNN